MRQKRKCVSRSDPRRGLSLLEVVLALGIFLGTYLVISEIVRRGSIAARQALAQNEAVQRAERVLNEILAGSQSFESSGPNPFQDDDRWSWTTEIADGPNTDLKQVSVTVRRSEGRNIAGETTLVRWARDPQIYLDAAAEAVTSSTSSSSSSSSSTTTP